MSRHPNYRKLAIVGIGSSKLSKDSHFTVGAHALQACRAAIIDSGLKREQIDGVGGIYSTDIPTVWPAYVIEGLGLNDVVWSSTASAPSANTVVDGINAVLAGSCNYALCFHAKYRWDVTSTSVRNHPMRGSIPMMMDPGFSFSLVAPASGAMAMAGAMRRHMKFHGSKREHFGMIAVNNRTNAQQNEGAVFYGEPLTMDEYMASRPVYAPFTMLDMDPPIDGGMAVIVTTAERAADLPHKPVYIDSWSNGITTLNDMAFQQFDSYRATKLLADTLFQRADCTPKDIDIANLYDGFTILTMDWIESTFVKRGEGAGFLEDSWDKNSQTVKFYGRVPLSPHGGNLSEGRVQGMGHVLEGVRQLRGEAGIRQAKDARRALVLNGTNPVNAGMILGVE